MKKKVLFVILFAIMFLPVISVSAVTKVGCGNITGIPEKIPELTSFAIIFAVVVFPVPRGPENIYA